MMELAIQFALDRARGFTYATALCPEHMCQGTDKHPGDHYIQREYNGKTVTTYWPREA